MHELLFSVVVPIYKVERFICDCVDSILSQTFDDFELILVDDGSPDSCSQICDEYAEKDGRVRVVHRSNGGLVSARQSGVSIARGKYSVCVDSDDWVAKDYLEELSKIIYSRNPDIVCSGMKLVDSDRERYVCPDIGAGFYDRKEIEKKIFPGLFQDEYARCFEPNICSKAIRTSIYKKAQLKVDPNIRNGEDSTCTRQCFFVAQSVYVIDHGFYYYRVNHSSMTKNKKPFPWNQKDLTVKNLMREIDMAQYDFQEQLYRSIVHGTFNICVSQFYDSNRSYRVIHSDICRKLNESTIFEAVKNAKFKSLKAKLMRLSLRYKLVFLLRLYAHFC